MSNPFRFVWAVRRCSAGRPFLVGVQALRLAASFSTSRRRKTKTPGPMGRTRLGLRSPQVTMRETADGVTSSTSQTSRGKHLVVSGSRPSDEYTDTRCHASSTREVGIDRRIALCFNRCYDHRIYPGMIPEFDKADRLKRRSRFPACRSERWPSTRRPSETLPSIHLGRPALQRWAAAFVGRVRRRRLQPRRGDVVGRDGSGRKAVDVVKRPVTTPPPVKPAAFGEVLLHLGRQVDRGRPGPRRTPRGGRPVMAPR